MLLCKNEFFKKKSYNKKLFIPNLKNNEFQNNMIYIQIPIWLHVLVIQKFFPLYIAKLNAAQLAKSLICQSPIVE